MSRVKMPSVTTSMRVLRDTFEPKRTRRPTVSPTLLAERRGHALGRGARGEPARLQHQDFLVRRPGLVDQPSGTRVVLPAPGGATSTAAWRCRSAAVSARQRLVDRQLGVEQTACADWMPRIRGA